VKKIKREFTTKMNTYTVPQPSMARHCRINTQNWKKKTKKNRKKLKELSRLQHIKAPHITVSTTQMELTSS